MFAYGALGKIALSGAGASAISPVESSEPYTYIHTYIHTYIYIYIYVIM